MKFAMFSKDWMPLSMFWTCPA